MTKEAPKPKKKRFGGQKKVSTLYKHPVGGPREFSDEEFEAEMYRLRGGKPIEEKAPKFRRDR